MTNPRNDIKFLFFILLAVIGLVFIAMICLCLFFLPKTSLFKIAAFWAPYTCWLMKVILDVKINVVGSSYIPRSPCIIASNHQTPYDGIIFDSILPRHSYVAKKSILKIPIFGWLFSLTRPIYIDRTKRRQAMKQIIRGGIKRMVGGVSVIIFPEGKRSSNGQLNQYKRGCANLSWSSRMPILPIYHTTFKCFSRSGKYKGPGIITIVIGRTIPPKNKSVKEINNILFTWTKHKEFSNRIN